MTRRAPPLIRPAMGPDDAEVVRLLRNAGRSWFGDDREIGQADQRAWWARHASSEGFACLLAGDPPIGYGMLQVRDDGRRWVSLAVTPAERGRGTGTAIYRALRDLASAGESIYAGIRRDNAPSIAAARRAGYELDALVEPPVADPEAWIVLRGQR